MTVITRFAPSPTGFLHIGGVRTAYFNWLYARRFNGRYLLRIEDTDRERSTRPAIDAIYTGLDWLGLTADAPAVLQSQNQQDHIALAHHLLGMGAAYRCYATPQELDHMRQQARAEGRTMRYDGRWRNKSPTPADKNTPSTIRFKAPQTGTTHLDDLIQGRVTVQNDQLDDMILLRSDGTPTYMLSVVADDHAMGITHIIRGDDHLTNSFRQYHLYQALGWQRPCYAHMPLLHGKDGKKLSKRHGALNVIEWKQQGYLPEAILNYLLRLGWSHGDDEIISRQQACQWFDIAEVGKAAARFDHAKLEHLNAYYLRLSKNDDLLSHIEPFMPQPPRPEEKQRLLKGLGGLKMRARTIKELAQNSLFYFDNYEFNDKALDILVKTSDEIKHIINYIFEGEVVWHAESIEQSLRHHAEKHGLPMKLLAQPLRAALTGHRVSPPLFDIMAILGMDTCRKRWRQALKKADNVTNGHIKKTEEGFSKDDERL